MKKILSYLLLIALLIIPMTGFAYYDKVDDTDQKVYDYADALTKSEEKNLQKIAENFLAEYKMDMVIVVVERDYNAYEIEAYADDFYDYNNFGYGSTNDGIIIAIDISHADEGYYYIAVDTTGKAIKRYTDKEIDKIFDHLGNNKPKGVYSMIKGFTDDAKKYSSENKSAMPYFMLIILPFVISGITIGILISKNKMVRKATTAQAYLNKDEVNITKKEDRYVTTHVTRVPINTSSGGSSTHRGSSGISHGGGGRRV